MSRRKPDGVPGAGWTQRDEVLCYTCHLASLVDRGDDFGQVEEILAPFPTGADRLCAVGAFTLSDYVPLGDGSWQVSTPFVFGTGALGAGLVAGSLIGGSVARSRARRAAAAAAVPRWVPIERGNLFIGRRGFHMHTPNVFSWDWKSITGATLVAPATLHFTGESAHGPVSWLLHCDYAELVFILWASDRHPRHPQLVTGGWLPQGWPDHARRHGRAPWPVPELPALPPGSDEDQA